jgi:acetyl-CoA C-acetyltransferase
MSSTAHIIGAGRTAFGVLGRSADDLLAEATGRAIADAGIAPADLDAVIVANFVAGPAVGQLHLSSLLTSLLGISVPAFRIEAACASGGAALSAACDLIGSRHQTVLVAGVEVMSSAPAEQLPEIIAAAGHRELEYAQGLVFPAAYAMIAEEYMRRFGVAHEVLSRVAVKNHDQGCLNPLAHFFGKRITIEQAEAAPVVASPLRRYDCCPVSDGAVALVLSAEQTPRSVSVLGSALRSGELLLGANESLTSFPAARAASAAALAEAGATPADIDLFEVHDCFTIAELVALEDIGVCGPGEAAELVVAGETGPAGSFPTNVDGGLKADGHPIGATGLAQAYECVAQLRGEAGQRQLSGVGLCLTHSVGGVGGTVAVHVLGRS